jgi:hypothetical protein
MVYYWYMTRICTKCKQEKSCDEFARKTADRLHSWCKQCNRDYKKAHYLANAAEYKAKAKAWRTERSAACHAWLVGYLLAHPCVDCGESDPVVLQFDHVRGVKRADISELMHDRVPIAVLEAEGMKCNIRCANCHIRRTARQFGWRRLGIELGAVDELEESAALQAVSFAGSTPVCATASRGSIPRGAADLGWCNGNTADC